MVRQRVVLGSIGDGERARRAARRLRDEGQEVVYVGGEQTPEQLVRALIAEDAASIVVDGDAESLARIAELCVELGAGDVARHASRRTSWRASISVTNARTVSATTPGCDCTTQWPATTSTRRRSGANSATSA